MVEDRKHRNDSYIKPWDWDFPCLLKFARLMVTFMLIASDINV